MASPTLTRRQRRAFAVVTIVFALAAAATTTLLLDIYAHHRQASAAVTTQDSSTLWVSPADPHPNGHANRLFAEHLLPRLEPMVSAATAPSGTASR